MNAIKEAMMAATVRFPERGGQGVLVPGGLIITAAHVVNWTHTGRMALGDDTEFVQTIEVAGGNRLLVYPLAVEPVADLAVLGALDGQWAPEQYEAFWQFCKTTPAVKLATAEFPFNKPIPAHVLSHTGRWISGHVEQMATDAHSLALCPDEQVEGGTSGGPVVTDDGLLLGVVSWIGASMGSIPRPHLTAPVWVVRQIESSGAMTALE